jgi:hypothetical protein
VNGAAKVWATWRTAPFGQKAFAPDHLAGKKGLVTVLLLFVTNPTPAVISSTKKATENGEKFHSTFARVMILCVCAKSVRRLQRSHLTFFPQGNRERQGSLAQLEVMALRIRQNVGGRSVAETVKSSRG